MEKKKFDRIAERLAEQEQERRAQKSIGEGISEAVRAERAKALERQKKTGIAQPARTDFAKGLEPEKDQAMERIWKAGPKSKLLYIRIAKGLATLSWPDVIELSSLADIESLAEGLLSGRAFKEVINW